MIALLLVAAQVATAPAQPEASDITVVGSRLRKIRLAAQTDQKGRVTKCEVTVSSGDSAFDGQACLATRDCAAEGKAAGDPMTDCVDRRLIAFVTASRDDRRFREKINAPN
jgi:hypothetical protein